MAVGPRWSGAVDVDAVTALVERVAREVVSPRFRALQHGDVGEKGADDVVTVVDLEAEAALIAGLGEIAPGVPVVGEEGAAADASLLDTLRGAPLAWVVDPLDGTRAFVAGSPDHAVMVALLAHGEPVAGWIHLPEHGRMLVAERGSGAHLNGAPLAALRPPARPRLAIAGAWVPAGRQAELVDRGAAAGLDVSVGERLWSGYSYGQVVTGHLDALVYWRTWPWDHAPGTVMVRELGGAVRGPDGPDGADYRPDVDRGGLVVAADDRVLTLVRDTLAPRA